MGASSRSATERSSVRLSELKRGAIRREVYGALPAGGGPLPSGGGPCSVLLPIRVLDRLFQRAHRVRAVDAGDDGVGAVGAGAVGETREAGANAEAGGAGDVGHPVVGAEPGAGAAGVGIGAGGGTVAGAEAAVQAFPGVAGGVAGLGPGQTRAPASFVSALLQVALDVVPAVLPVLGPRLPAILVRRSELVVAAIGGVGAVAVVLAPMSLLLRGIDRLGDFLAGEAARDSAHGGADHGPHGSTHRDAHGRACRRAAQRAHAGADRVRCGLAGDGIMVRFDPRLVLDGGRSGLALGRIGIVVAHGDLLDCGE